MYKVKSWSESTHYISEDDSHNNFAVICAKSMAERIANLLNKESSEKEMIYHPIKRSKNGAITM